MKKFLLFVAVLSGIILPVNATKHTVTINGFVYSPALLTAHIGDTVTISASTFHPLVQVSKTSWDTDDTTPVAGGWGRKTSNYTFTITTLDTIYFVCEVHVSVGLKGRVIVSAATGMNDVPNDQFGVLVYPNPVASTGTIQLSASGSNPVSVFILSINGQLEKDLTSKPTITNGHSYYQFDAGTIAGGNHLVMVTDGRNMMVKKFQVIR